jgi:hypothetical protein
LSVLISKLLETSSGKLIILAIALTLGFHMIQRRNISPFLNRYSNQFEFNHKSNTNLILIMILPSLILAIGFLITFILMK